MKKMYLIMTLVCIMMVSCKPNDEDDNGNKEQINGHEYIDLGLPSGLKWSTCNVGANKPEEYGNYYAWGETSPKNEYTTENSSTYFKQMEDFSGNPKYDVATAKWGGSWRMPTKEDMEELNYCCEWEWTQVNGVYGSKVIGPNGKSIFFPSAGYRDGSSLYYAGEGYCWSSTPNDYFDGSAFSLSFDSDDHCMYDSKRYYGLSVRPVLE